MKTKNNKFNQMVSEEERPLKGFALKLTKDMEDAEDLVQDTMLKAFTNSDKFREGTNLKGWLYTIMKNIFINFGARKIAYVRKHDFFFSFITREFFKFCLHLPKIISSSLSGSPCCSQIPGRVFRSLPLHPAEPSAPPQG